MLAIYFWSWGLPWNMVNIASKTPLEKTSFFRCNWVLIQMTSWLGMGVCVAFHISTLSIRTPSDLNWPLCACCHSLCQSPCASVLLCLEALVPSFLWLLESFSLLFCITLSLWGRSLMKTLHLRLSVPKFLTVCTSSSCWSLC